MKKKNIYALLCLFGLLSFSVNKVLLSFDKNSAFKAPDTIVVKMKKMRGFGPFEQFGGLIRQIHSGSQWANAVPKIHGIPDTLDKMMFNTIQIDFIQHTYQSYYSGKLSKEFFNYCIRAWNADTSIVTKDIVKGDIGVAAGIDRNNRTVVIADQNNNYDLSDDKPLILPLKTRDYFYTPVNIDSQSVKVEYEYFDGKSIKKTTTWILFGHSIMTANLPDSLIESIELFYTIIEHRIGELFLNGNNYQLAMFNAGGRGVYRDDYRIAIILDNTKIPIEHKNLISKNEVLVIGNNYYEPVNVSPNGEYITFVKDDEAYEKGGTQIGMKAIDFLARTLERKEIKLKDYRGKYVFLEFWGTWCMPCRQELPYLKKIYQKYKDKNFEMIGIANDDLDKLKSYVKEEDIRWHQIHQKDSENRELLDLYNITGYPTNFLINPEGIIVDKFIPAEKLDTLLDDLK